MIFLLRVLSSLLCRHTCELSVSVQSPHRVIFLPLPLLSYFKTSSLIWNPSHLESLSSSNFFQTICVIPPRSSPPSTSWLQALSPLPSCGATNAALL